MMTIAMLLAASQIRPAADLDELRWRRFVHAAVATETPFATRLAELRRSVGRLPGARLPRGPRGMPGPSGM